jgi:hypothetical protein
MQFECPLVSFLRIFEMKSTNYVEDELVNAWAPFKAAMNTSSNFIELVYDFITTYVLKYMGASAWAG